MHKQLIIDKSMVLPSRPDFEVIGVFNPAIIQVDDQYVMIARVAEGVKQSDPDFIYVPHFIHAKGVKIEKIPRHSPDYDYSDPRIIKNTHQTFLTSVSHFRIVRSRNGIDFDFEHAEMLFPDNIYEEYGIEDPRITKIGDAYYVTFSAVSSNGINVRLMKTVDFKKFKRFGNILHSDNKDCVLFPEKINGRFYALHRPSISQFGKLDIWLAESDNLSDWGNHQIMLDARINYQPSVRIGAGAVPFLTNRGWVVIYHSADCHHRYHLSAMLLDRSDPHRILMKSKEPLIAPTECYEQKGFVNDVVFTCGLIEGDGYLDIYYGVCDEHIAKCRLSMQELWDNLEAI